YGGGASVVAKPVLIFCLFDGGSGDGIQTVNGGSTVDGGRQIDSGGRM
ncbi:hypothetical protein A2U01_0118938, partial [Trifolium medium]|nr:hypothetical protein [Trifolium medium]